MKCSRMVLFIQNDPVAPACSFAPWLDEVDVSHGLVRAYAGEPLPAADSWHPLIVLGGVMGVHDAGRHPFLAAEIDHLREAAVAGVPILGICLGGQLLAAALGARVAPGTRGERGCCPITLTAEGEGDPLFAGIPGQFAAIELHNDSFDLPEGATHLASSAGCLYQAFRFGRAAYGLQFHPEVDEQTLSYWMRMAPMEEQTRTSYLTAFRAYFHTWQSVHRRLLSNFLALAGSAK
ncbi:MAG: type 1 glutamine amidotransferase [Bacillota bacterium]|nr:type 1 glutamine amidotransferase [Bacillota bacterium]